MGPRYSRVSVLGRLPVHPGIRKRNTYCVYCVNPTAAGDNAFDLGLWVSLRLYCTLHIWQSHLLSLESDMASSAGQSTLVDDAGRSGGAPDG